MRSVSKEELLGYSKHDTVSAMEKWQQQNQQTIARGLQLIAGVPFTRLVALTGSLAEGRATDKSDIDFFVMVEPGHIWLTRFWVTLLLESKGIRRTDTDITGKICLNWFATFDAPANQQGRIYQELWREEKPGPKKLLLEQLFGGRWLENWFRGIQMKRIEADPRTHAPGSQVRYSDSELGFHPKKEFNS